MASEISAVHYFAYVQVFKYLESRLEGQAAPTVICVSAKDKTL